MKAYIGIKYHEDYRNKVIIDKISSILKKMAMKQFALYVISIWNNKIDITLMT